MSFMWIMLFVMGTCVGSFVNMLIYRTAIRYKLSRKKIHNKHRSFCDHCGQKLKWSDNLPIISWLILGGKSRCCQKKLSISYPLVELSTGLLFVVTVLVHRSERWELVVLDLILISLLWFSTLFDWKYMILPDFSTIMMVGVELMLVKANLLPYLTTGVGMMGIYWLMNVFTKGKGMGLGDVKLAFVVGLLTGWPRAMVAFYVAFVVGAVVGLVMVTSRGWQRSHQIPFGPFMILGAVVAWWWGKLLISQIPNLPLQ